MRQTVYLDLTDKPEINDEVEVLIHESSNSHGEPYTYARIDVVWRTHPAGLGPIWDEFKRLGLDVDQIDFSDE